MSAYQLAFSFREPYQVLLDSHFLKTCHAFHMPLQRYLENTLHGQCRLFVTNCTIAKVMAEFEKEKEKVKASGGRPKGRPDFLPPPLEVPMRYCKHKNNEGEELGVIDESRCLLDLLAGQPHGNELAKNKQHYILATAEPDEKEQKRKGYLDVRERARMIPGVPVVYVKRSVMILEELSGVSERSKNKAEKAKFSDGLIDTRKRKRGEAGDGSDDELEDLLLEREEQAQGQKVRGLKRAKGPNPMSVRKKKIKTSGEQEQRTEGGPSLEEGARRKRTRRGKRGKGKSDLDKGPASEGTHAPEPPSSKPEE
jgi:U3 small nucleolar RNA-associated protein 23